MRLAVHALLYGRTDLLHSHSLHRLDLIFDLTGTNPDYPTYVAIKGTVFDVSGNKAYGPEGSYRGKSCLLSPLDICLSSRLQQQKKQLTKPNFRSLRRQRRLPRSGAVLPQTRRVPARLVGSVGRAQESAQRLVHFL
jgi:predicted heme/steroid binding protein